MQYRISFLFNSPFFLLSVSSSEERGVASDARPGLFLW